MSSLNESVDRSVTKLLAMKRGNPGVVTFQYNKQKYRIFRYFSIQIALERCCSSPRACTTARALARSARGSPLTARWSPGTCLKGCRWETLGHIHINRHTSSGIIDMIGKELIEKVMHA